MPTQSVLLEELAAQVIHVFEDSCGDEWLGQTIECCVDGGDGSFRYLTFNHLVCLGDQTIKCFMTQSTYLLREGKWSGEYGVN